MGFECRGGAVADYLVVAGFEDELLVNIALNNDEFSE
jgi:hypothetical protein